MAKGEIQVIDQLDKSCRCDPDDTCLCELDLKLCDICAEGLEKMIVSFVAYGHTERIFVCHSCQENFAIEMAKAFGKR